MSVVGDDGEYARTDEFDVLQVRLSITAVIRLMLEVEVHEEAVVQAALEGVGGRVEARRRDGVWRLDWYIVVRHSVMVKAVGVYGGAAC